MQLQPILKALRKADQDFSMIRPREHVAVALSGGKDSLLLLHALREYQKFQHTDFTLSAIHVDVGFEENLNEELQDYCRSLGVPLHIVKTKIFDSLQEPAHMRNGKIQCSLCATRKKGVLFREAKRLGISSVAFGHHGDDALETLFLNMIYGGRMAAFSARMHLEKAGVDEIRPFIYLDEPQIRQAIHQNGIPSLKRVCPNDGYTQRQQVKEFLEELYERFPEARKNFLNALVHSDFLSVPDPQRSRLDDSN